MEADCWKKEETAHKCTKYWKQKEARTEVNASNVEQVWVCIEIEENLVFEVCGGLINEWKEEVHGLDENGPSDAHEDKQCQTDD